MRVRVPNTATDERVAPLLIAYWHYHPPIMVYPHWHMVKMDGKGFINNKEHVFINLLYCFYWYIIHSWGQSHI